MSDFEIRLLEQKDLRNGFLDVLKELAPVNLAPRQAEDVFRVLPLGKYIFVAISDGCVVGTASVFFERKFIHGGALVAHVEDVAVGHYYQGQGIGCALVGRCMEVARQLGCYKAVLTCSEENRGFYELLGFYPHQNHMRYDIQKRPA